MVPQLQGEDPGNMASVCALTDPANSDGSALRSFYL